MTLRVPLAKATESGLRTLSSKVQMDEAVVTLKGKAKKKIKHKDIIYYKNYRVN